MIISTEQEDIVGTGPTIYGHDVIQALRVSKCQVNTLITKPVLLRATVHSETFRKSVLPVYHASSGA